MAEALSTSTVRLRFPERSATESLKLTSGAPWSASDRNPTASASTHCHAEKNAQK
jgi:hypothetical protein